MLLSSFKLDGLILKSLNPKWSEPKSKRKKICLVRIRAKILYFVSGRVRNFNFSFGSVEQGWAEIATVKAGPGLCLKNPALADLYAVDKL